MFDKDLIRKASQIKLLVTDIDGVWTNVPGAGPRPGVGGPARRAEGSRRCPASGVLESIQRSGGAGSDEEAQHALRFGAGIETAIITGEDSAIVAQRAKKLKVEDVYLGVHDKLAVMEELMEKHNLLPEEVAYIGDDVNDFAPMQVAGLTAAPANTPVFSQLKPDVLLTRKGGDGAFREFADMILLAQNWENQLP